MDDARRITFAKMMSATKAILTANKVSEEIFKERFAICQACQFKRTDRGGVAFCGQCGCQVSDNKTAFLNLCRYEEKLPEWGCKFPRRPEGGWKR